MSSAILAESTTGPNVTVDDDDTVDAEDVEVKAFTHSSIWDDEW